MPIDYETGGDLNNSGKYIDQEGWYHFIVTLATEVPTKKDGSIMSGAIGQIGVECVASTVQSEIGKSTDFFLWPPDSSHKDGGDFGRKILDRWWLALSLVSRQQLETKGARVKIDLPLAKGRQFIARMVKDDKNPKFVRLDGANIFHVDDPAVKDQPKDPRYLSIIPVAERWVGSQAAPKQEAAKPEPPKHPAATGVDLGVL